MPHVPVTCAAGPAALLQPGVTITWMEKVAGFLGLAPDCCDCDQSRSASNDSPQEHRFTFSWSTHSQLHPGTNCHAALVHNKKQQEPLLSCAIAANGGRRLSGSGCVGSRGTARSLSPRSLFFPNSFATKSSFAETMADARRCRHACTLLKWQRMQSFL
jgi:hypothetical protein